MKTNKLGLLVLILLLFAGKVHAQKRRSSGPPKQKTAMNAVKLNPLGIIAYRNVPIYFERAIYGPIAVSAGFGYKIPTKVGGAYGSAIENVVNNLGGEADFGKIKGWSVTPELKFYVGEKGAPNGFYIAPYFRYSKYTLNMSASGTNPEDSVYYQADVALSYRSIGGGIQLGAQWILGDHFALDWFFFGPGYINHVLSVDVQSNVVSSSQWAEWESEFESDVKSEVGDLPVVGGFLSKFEADAKTNGFDAKMPFNFPNWRFGLSLGYAF